MDRKNDLEEFPLVILVCACHFEVVHAKSYEKLT